MRGPWYRGTHLKCQLFFPISLSGAGSGFRNCSHGTRVSAEDTQSLLGTWLVGFTEQDKIIYVLRFGKKKGERAIVQRWGGINLCYATRWIRAVGILRWMMWSSAAGGVCLVVGLAVIKLDRVWLLLGLWHAQHNGARLSQESPTQAADSRGRVLHRILEQNGR